MAWEARSGLKLIEWETSMNLHVRLNGLGSPFGFETLKVRLNSFFQKHG